MPWYCYSYLTVDYALLRKLSWHSLEPELGIPRTSFMNKVYACPNSLSGNP